VTSMARFADNINTYLADRFTARAVAKAPAMAGTALQDMLERKVSRRDNRRAVAFRPDGRTVRGTGSPPNPNKLVRSICRDQP
jgi:hypothetical protein